MLTCIKRDEFGPFFCVFLCHFFSFFFSLSLSSAWYCWCSVCACVYRKEDEAISRKYIKDNNNNNKKERIGERQLAPGRIYSKNRMLCCVQEGKRWEKRDAGGYIRIIYIIKRLDHGQATASLTQGYMAFVHTSQPVSQPAKRGYIQPPPYIIGGEKSLRQRHLFLHCVAALL